MADKRRIVIAGGSGTLGSSLSQHLASLGFECVALTRRDASAPPGAGSCLWDGRTVAGWADALDGAAALVNLCGRSVDCVKTPDRCDEILRSRVEPTRALGAALRAVGSPPPIWVQMSTAHIYGDPPHDVCDEGSSLGYGLAPTVGRAWEQACAESGPTGVRRVILRTGFVLGRGGGALRRLTGLARWGLGGRIGHGRQGMSWIHERDFNRICESAITQASITGVYNATAPNPVSNAEFMRSLRLALRRPIGLPSPAWLVAIGARLILRTDPELALYGRYCVPRRLLDHGFVFDFPELDAALRDLIRRRE
ncbi:MAG: TIGR01777 family protein [Planctomycetota bacterium]|nr:MAG: TIGR01777 family protein [Planctomycetota bacterium]